MCFHTFLTDLVGSLEIESIGRSIRTEAKSLRPCVMSLAVLSEEKAHLRVLRFVFFLFKDVWEGTDLPSQRYLLHLADVLSEEKAHLRVLRFVFFGSRMCGKAPIYRPNFICCT